MQVTHFWIDVRTVKLFFVLARITRVALECWKPRAQCCAMKEEYDGIPPGLALLQREEGNHWLYLEVLEHHGKGSKPHASEL